MILPQSKEKDVLGKICSGSCGHLDVNKSLDKVTQGITGLRQETLLRSHAGIATPAQPVAAREPGV
jgi:hypothetical protein